jgi:hypothetical protein
MASDRLKQEESRPVSHTAKHTLRPHEPLVGFTVYAPGIGIYFARTDYID